MLSDPTLKKKVHAAISSLLADKRFVSAITYSTNGTQSVSTRFEMAEETLEKLL
jgi:hypothetical protein